METLQHPHTLDSCPFSTKCMLVLNDQSTIVHATSGAQDILPDSMIGQSVFSLFKPLLLDPALLPQHVKESGFVFKVTRIDSQNALPKVQGKSHLSGMTALLNASSESHVKSTPLTWFYVCAHVIPEQDMQIWFIDDAPKLRDVAAQAMLDIQQRGKQEMPSSTRQRTSRRHSNAGIPLDPSTSSKPQPIPIPQRSRMASERVVSISKPPTALSDCYTTLDQMILDKKGCILKLNMFGRILQVYPNIRLFQQSVYLLRNHFIMRFIQEADLEIVCKGLSDACQSGESIFKARWDKEIKDGKKEPHEQVNVQDRIPFHIDLGSDKMDMAVDKAFTINMFDSPATVVSDFVTSRQIPLLSNLLRSVSWTDSPALNSLTESSPLESHLSSSEDSLDSTQEPWVQFHVLRLLDPADEGHASSLICILRPCPSDSTVPHPDTLQSSQSSAWSPASYVPFYSQLKSLASSHSDKLAWPFASSPSSTPKS